ncbi:hypothetical protein [Vibrio superstes]|uniref:Uncharacterized protein n=1 Tax=Vibrio superstes NBRC 103154 TaxID=1219062 RepID=A0A511QMZ0_9VIBR|nr:hypothetical protein [Vibrio superstes]GEM78517.1 hypothetical protein VSU01S_07620 [Vibrio superstes NBRC 103154]
METIFSWYEYGNLIENDRVTLLRFFTKNGLLNIEANRIKARGVADIEFSERGTDYDSRATITKRIWNTETPNMIVTAEDEFDGLSERSTTAVIGTSTKIKLRDDNSQQWDCSYTTVSNGNVVNYGCTNERTSKRHSIHWI